MFDLNKLSEKSKELGAAAAAVVNVSDIKFSDEFRKLCEQNSCGKYGTSWMCPPAVGELDQLISQAKNFSKGVVFQTVHELEDSFDFEGMEQAAEVHEKVFRSILEYIKIDLEVSDFLALNAGHCKFCDKCSYPDGEECRFPDKAVASVESYGIDVNALVTGCGIPYINGANTVSYVGLFLF